MKLVILHSPKGGSGKSTLARELAVAAVLAGRRVALADLDPQGTTRGWYDRRQDQEPAVVAFDPVRPDLERLAGAFDLLLVDTPPGAHAWLASLVELADAVLVPVRPTPDDLLGAAPIAAALEGCPWAFVLTQVAPRSRLAVQAVRQLAGLGKVAPVSLGFRQEYPAASIEGRAAVEYTGGKGQAEVTELLAYVTKSLLREKRHG